METFWFLMVALMLTAYVLLDGFDLGAGAVHLLVARTEAERRLALRAIGPVWDGNEVWLLAAGGTLYFAFPSLYAASFSGFYLALIIVLWLLILRGVSVEFRNHIDSPVWRPVWDVGFAVSGALLAVVFGAAIGNVVRGVPLDASGKFFLPLWTDFGLEGELGILDWYTVTVGFLALAALVEHGALWLVLKTDGEVARRALGLAGGAWFAVVILTVLVTVLTLRVQPLVAARLAEHPWGYVFPLLSLAGLVAVLFAGRRARLGFLGSCAYLTGMLAAAAFGLYPNVLPARPDPALSLTIHNTAASPYGLRTGLLWWIPGMILVAGYFIYVYRHFAGKVSLEGEGY